MHKFLVHAIHPKNAYYNAYRSVFANSKQDAINIIAIEFPKNFRFAAHDMGLVIFEPEESGLGERKCKVQ